MLLLALPLEEGFLSEEDVMFEVFELSSFFSFFPFLLDEDLVVGKGDDDEEEIEDEEDIPDEV